MPRILIFLFTVVLLSACQKEVDDLLGTNGTGSGGGNNSTSDYQPVSANSEWDYLSTTSGSSHTVALGTDTTINGLRYYEFNKTSNGTTERGYISKIDGIYRTYGNFDPVGQVIELVYLKDSAVGTNWTNTISVNGFSNYHKYTVARRDIQHTVKGKTYNTVIELTYDFSVDDPINGGVINIGGGKYYYAKDVGLIEAYFSFSYFGVSTSDTTQLVNYTIR
ncbi:MAG TPA: hypothetical protein VJ765_02835 [Chitinophagaceae bacterium]|nr:hypothetical protein [Chitinophagaceae bacterium]